MKIRNFMWAMLPLVAPLVLASCSSSSDDETASPTTPTQTGVKKIPYTVVVGSSATRRATVGEKDGSGNYPLYFAKGDKLYVTSADGKVHGMLPVEDQYEGQTAATISGELTCDAGATLNDQTQMTVTLVGKDNVGVQFSGDKVTGIDYGSALCATLDEAVRKYSLLTDTKPYGNKEFYIEQQTAFVDFTITLDEGTYDGATLDVLLEGFDGRRSGQVTAKHVYTANNTYGSIQARFFVSANKGANVSKTAAKLKMGSNAAQQFLTNDYTLQRGVSTVNKTVTDEGVQLWADGPKWAKSNLGAARDVDFGNYYAFGETTASTDVLHFRWANYTLCDGTINNMTKYNATDGKLSLDITDDAARVALGSTWRIPTVFDIEKLDKDLTKEWIDGENKKYRLQNVAGAMIKGDGIYGHKAIFLPAAGGYATNVAGTTSSLVNVKDVAYYWTSELDDKSWWDQLDYPIWYTNPNASYSQDQECKKFFALRYDLKPHDSFIWCANRCDGFPIRPVK